MPSRTPRRSPVDLWLLKTALLKAAFLIAALVMTALVSSTASAQFVKEELWVTDGTVDAMVATNDRLYVGGRFTMVGPATGGALALDLTTGQAQDPYPKVGGWVHAVAADGAGGWYIGGRFNTVQAQTRNNLAHVDAYGNLTAWNPNVNGAVLTLLVFGGTVYAGGEFTMIGGQARSRLAALDPVTGAPTAWNPGPDGTVRALLSFGSGAVFIGGDFLNVNGFPRAYVAAVDIGTGANTVWNPGTNGPVYALGVRFVSDLSNRIYIGGSFSTLGGQPRNNIGGVALNGVVSTWTANTNGAVRSIRTTAGTLTGHTVYLAGDFTSVSGVPRNYLASVASLDGAPTAWNPNPNDAVAAIALSGSDVYAAGAFTVIGNQARYYLGAVDNSGAAKAWDPRANDAGLALQVSGTKVYAGGAMTSVGGVFRSNLAAFDRVTGEATAWNPGANDVVLSMTYLNGIVYAGGRFTFAGGGARLRAAAFDAVTGALTGWNPAVNGPVFALLAHNGSIRAGGDFFEIGGTQRAYVAGLDATTGLATNWQPNADGAVYELVVREITEPLTTTIFVGGLFNVLGGQFRSRIGEVDPTFGTATSWNPPVFGEPGAVVLAIAPTPVFVHLGGAFYDIGLQPRAGIATLYGDTGALSGWNANTAFPCQVTSLVLDGGTLYVGGYFQGMGGQARASLAALNAAPATANNWIADVAHPVLVPAVASLLVRDQTVYVGGNFKTIKGMPHSGLAALSTAIVDAGSGPGFARIELRAMPNPSRASATIIFTSPAEGFADVAIFGANGSLVRRLLRGPIPAGEQALEWDGRDADGQAMPAGIYFVRAASPNAAAVAKLVRLP